MDQQVTSGGQGIISSGQNPADLIIWGTPTCKSIKMSGGSSFYGAVYAPSAVIDPSGGGDRYGAYVGKEVDCTGSGVYHYDEALAGVLPGDTTPTKPSTYGAPYSVAYWQEKE